MARRLISRDLTREPLEDGAWLRWNSGCAAAGSAAIWRLQRVGGYSSAAAVYTIRPAYRTDLVVAPYITRVDDRDGNPVQSLYPLVLRSTCARTPARPGSPTWHAPDPPKTRDTVDGPRRS